MLEKKRNKSKFLNNRNETIYMLIVCKECGITIDGKAASLHVHLRLIQNSRRAAYSNGPSVRLVIEKVRVKCLVARYMQHDQTKAT